MFQHRLEKKIIAWVTMALFALQPVSVFAEVTADPKAPQQQQPRVENAPNGVPVVEIAPPSAAGISHNIYQQFDVDPQGLILNNSPNITQTQLAGYIDRNIYLVQGPARIILNEVTGVNPTNLRGYTEVAGQRAEVIIANPNGIYGDGFGFLNTSRAVLTTGTPVVSSTGSLDAFRVTGGQVSIQGQGLDAGTVDQVDIISRSVAVNAGIWANNLNLLTGPSEVKYKDLSATGITGTGDAPLVAVDLGLLGGMYANKIYLVGTENGVGVNSKGTISATSGDFTVNSAGKVTLSGLTSAAGNVQIQAKDGLTNENTLFAQGNTQLSSQGVIENTGTIAAQQNVTLDGKSIISGGVLGAGIKSDGTFNTSGDLTVTASQDITTRQQNLAAGHINFSAAAIDMGGSTSYAGGNATLTAASGNIDHSSAMLYTEGTLTVQAKQNINNNQGVMTGNNNLRMTAEGDITNQSGHIETNKGLELSAQALNNRQGAIAAYGTDRADITITAELQNESGTIAGNGQAAVTAGSIKNQAGHILAQDNLALTTTGAINNTGGKIATDKTLQATAQTLTGNGEAAAGQALDLALGSTFVNEGTLLSNGNLSVATGGALVNQGSLLAQNNATISASSITNETAGTMAAGNNLSLNAAGSITNHGTVDGGTAAITGQNLINTALITGDTVTVNADTIINKDQTGVIYAAGEINLYARNTLENKDAAAIYSAGNINIAGDAAKDENGEYLKRTGTLLNQSASIEAAGNIHIAADQIINKKREFAVAQQVISETEHHEAAELPTPSQFSVGRVDVTYLSGVLDYTQTITDTLVVKDSPEASIIAGNSMALRADTITNDQGRIMAAGVLDAQADTITNTALARTRITTGEGRTDYYKRMKIPHHIRHDEIWHEHEYIPYYTQTLEQLPAYAAIFGGGQVVNITAANVNNVTINPGGQIGNIATTVPSGQTSGATGSVYTFNVPPGGLFNVHKEADAKYLVETDPRFTNYQTFLSSDYMLQKLAADPERVLKRLGDGFYEQKLVREQISQLTGRMYLDGYSSNEAQYMALLDSGVTFAQQFNLTVGVALTAEQMAQLTANIVWLIEKEVDGQKVLAPMVYLAGGEALKPSGAVISANHVFIDASDSITNSGMIKGGATTALSGANIINRGGLLDSSGLTQILAARDIINQSGTIAGNKVELYAQGDIKNETLTTQVQHGNVTTTLIQQPAAIKAREGLRLLADRDIINNGARIKAGREAAIQAGRNLEIGSVEHQEHKSSNVSTAYQSDTTTNIRSTIEAGGDATLLAAGDAALRGSKVTAGNDLRLAAEGNVTVTAVKDQAMEEKSNRGRKYYVHTKTDAETVVGSELTANGQITVAAARIGDTNPNRGNILIEGSYINADAVDLIADQNVTMQDVSERHESLVEGWSKKSGFLSSTTTKQRDHTIDNRAVGSVISGGAVNAAADRDLTVKGSSIVSDRDITLTAGNNVNINTAQETYDAEHAYYQKRSGLSLFFGSGGIGVFAGSTRQTQNSTEQGINQIGSTIGSLAGNVSIEAGKDASITGSEIIGKTGIDVSAGNINLAAATNTAAVQDTYEFKQSGLSVSVGNTALKAIGSAGDNIQHANEVEDSRLKALLDYRAARDLEKAATQIKKGNLSKGITISVGLSSTKQKSEIVTEIASSSGSSLTSDGDIRLRATGSGAEDAAGNAIDGDLNIIGSTVDGKNVELTAARDVNLKARENTGKIHTVTSDKTSGLSADFSGGFTGVSVNASRSKGNADETSLTNTESIVTARQNLIINSERDLNIIGSQASGNKVTVDAGRDLNIESLQDADTYRERNQTTGGSIGVSASGKVSGSATANREKTDSAYRSVVEQAGIFAGTGGFDIEVGGNTDLKGAVISSEATPDKNRLSTDTLTWSDIENQAEYEASSIGVSYSSKNDADNKLVQGFNPNIGVPASGAAASTTQSAVSLGTIDVRSNPNQDLSRLNRDPSGALNALGQIFDKRTVEEQQELARLFGEEAFQLVGTIAEKNGWKEGSPEKIALHALVGGIMADLGGNSFTSGAVGAGFSQAVQGELANIKDPDLRLIASALVGEAAAKIAGGVVQAGASTAFSGTKNNDYTHRTHKIGEIVYVPGDGFYKVSITGEDEKMSEDPKPGDVYWRQNPNNPDLGWEFVVGSGIDGDPYKEDTYINSWGGDFLKYAYDQYGNQITVNGDNILANYNSTYEEMLGSVTGSVGGTSFKTFKELKAFLGSPGAGNQWHHIVEQAQINASRAGFAAEEINSVENIIALQSGKESVHSAISAYYSSKQWFTGGLTVRDWLATKSFQEQFEFGMSYLKKFGEVIKENGSWIFKPFE